MATDHVIHIPGTGQEQLFLEPLDTILPSGERLIVEPTQASSPEALQALITRHQARYYFVGHFLRAGMIVLDFPCGSGYAAKLLAPQDIIYIGADANQNAVNYAQSMYMDYGEFSCCDLTTFKPLFTQYDVIACIEGLEHIDAEAQRRLIPAFYEALKPGGVLVISSPETRGDVSGPNPKNPYHKHELTKDDFLLLLGHSFSNVELITQRDVLDTGEEHTCFYAACRKLA